MTLDEQDLRERIRKALTSQKRPTITLLSSLLAVHDELGYLPEEAIEEVADFTGSSINDAWGVSTFYTNFRFSPPAQHIVEVCWGPTCHLAGSADILKRLLDDLGLSGEGDTEDKVVSLKYNTCLGACSQAPVVSIDHHLTGKSTPSLVSKSVSILRK